MSAVLSKKKKKKKKKKNGSCEAGKMALWSGPVFSRTAAEYQEAVEP